MFIPVGPNLLYDKLRVIALTCCFVNVVGTWLTIDKYCSLRLPCKVKVVALNLSVFTPETEWTVQTKLSFP